MITERGFPLSKLDQFTGIAGCWEDILWTVVSRRSVAEKHVRVQVFRTKRRWLSRGSFHADAALSVITKNSKPQSKTEFSLRQRKYNEETPLRQLVCSWHDGTIVTATRAKRKGGKKRAKKHRDVEIEVGNGSMEFRLICIMRRHWATRQPRSFFLSSPFVIPARVGKRRSTHSNVLQKGKMEALFFISLFFFLFFAHLSSSLSPFCWHSEWLFYLKGKRLREGLLSFYP